MQNTAVVVVAPNPLWPQMFEREQVALLTVLGDAIYSLHHIGSTAIAGIHAKPVIDMLAVVPSLELLDAQSRIWRAVGYEVMGEFGIEGRRYFRKTLPSGVRTHQVHAFAGGDAHIRRHLAFVAYMNAHPQAAAEYSNLKRELALRHPHDMNAYMDGKDAFIKRHEAMALAKF